MLDFLVQCVVLDPYTRDLEEYEPEMQPSQEELREFLGSNPRFIALKAIAQNYPTHPKTLPLLHDRAQNDPDEQLRQWAQEQLQKLESSPG